MTPLSTIDASFLHVESAEMPMHIGGLHVLDLPAGYEGDFLEDVKKHMRERLHLASIFTRKLALMPFDLSNPVWVDDDDLDLDYHIRHVTLPKPGSNRQLQQVVARMHSSLLDRSRPLWEIVVIDGLRSGQVGLYVKAHHAGVDGQAGVAIGRALFDGTPTGRKIRPPRQKPRRDPYQLGVAELAMAAVRNSAQQYLKLATMAPDFLNVFQGLLSPALGKALPVWSPPGVAPGAGKPADNLVGGLLNSPLASLLAPRTPMNVAITNQRTFAGRTTPTAEVKEIARTFGVSFNDVVLGVVAGAMRNYLMASDELPAKSLSAAVPMSLRAEDDGTANNQVGMMVTDLCTDVADPVERLRKIGVVSTQRKAVIDPVKGAMGTDVPIFASPWLISGLASLYGRSRLADWMPPVANLVVSNVAGHNRPMYFAGATVVTHYPVSIPSHGMALNITVHSYNGRLDYGLIACRRAFGDLTELGDDLLAEHRLLLSLARNQAAAAGTAAAEAALPEQSSVVPPEVPAAAAEQPQVSSGSELPVVTMAASSTDRDATHVPEVILSPRIELDAQAQPVRRKRPAPASAGRRKKA